MQPRRRGIDIGPLTSSVLVTGGGGQLGKALADALPEGIVLGSRDLDITDREAVMRKVSRYGPDLVVNAAAFTKVDAAEADPEQAFVVNAEGARNVAEASEAAGAWLVQVSTDYVYRGDKAGPYTEEDEPAPLSVYGKSKLAGELAARACSKTLIVRTSWVFGDGSNFFRTIIGAAFGGAPRLSVVSDQKGLPTFAPDLARGVLGLAAKKTPGIFHLAGSGPPASWAEAAGHALDSARLGVPVAQISTEEYAASREGPLAPRPANSVLDCSKAAALGVSLPPWPEAVAGYARRCRAELEKQAN